MSLDGKDNGLENIKSVESSTKQPEGFGAKLKAHLRKFWWLHFLLFVAITLILVFCLLYAVFPRVSQDDINKSTLTTTSLILTNPGPTSFHLRQAAYIINNSPYHPQLDAFNATLSLQGGRPYAAVTLPHVHALQNASTMVDQDVVVTDLGAFADYNVAVLQQESITVNLRGRTGLHEMRFPGTTVDYNKLVTMKGLNQLKGFAVTDFSIKLTAEPDGTNMVGTVYIPNPSVMTLTMGNVTFNNYIDATPPQFIGTSTITDLVLVPGNNTVPMSSIVNQTLVIGAIQHTYKDGLLPIAITGATSVYDGQHLQYYEKALAQNTQHVTLDVGSALKKLGLGAVVGGGG